MPKHRSTMCHVCWLGFTMSELQHGTEYTLHAPYFKMDANPNPSLKHLQQVKREELDQIKGHFTVIHTLNMNMCLCEGQGSRVPEASTVRSVSAVSPAPRLAHHSPMDRTQPGLPGSQSEGTGPKSHSTDDRGPTPDPESQHGERTPPSSVTKGIQIFTTYNILSAH